VATPYFFFLRTSLGFATEALFIPMPLCAGSLLRALLF